MMMIQIQFGVCQWITTPSDRKQIQLSKPMYLMLIMTPQGSIFLLLQRTSLGYIYGISECLSFLSQSFLGIHTECRNRLSCQLWLASLSNSDNLSSESLVESPTRRIDPLLNLYSDYEDSVYVDWDILHPSPPLNVYTSYT